MIDANATIYGIGCRQEPRGRYLKNVRPLRGAILLMPARPF
jgi:hypothetical protein